MHDLKYMSAFHPDIIAFSLSELFKEFLTHIFRMNEPSALIIEIDRMAVVFTKTISVPKT